MRLAALAATVMLLTVVVPAVAHTGAPNHGPCNENDERGKHVTTEYTCTMEIDEDLYAQAGWWGANGYSVNNTTENRDDHEPIWLHLDSTDNDVPFDVTVTSKGGVIAGMDVYKYRHGSGEHSGFITPGCPQGLVDDVPPEQTPPNAGQYLFHLLHLTTERHQRGVSTPFPVVTAGDGAVSDLESTMRVQLDPDDSPDGYIVAIYPQASAGVAQQEGKPSIEYSVVAEDEDDLTLYDDLQDKQPETPFLVENWVFPTFHAFSCVDRLTQLTAGEAGVDAPGLSQTLPDSPDAPSAQGLLDTHL